MKSLLKFLLFLVYSNIYSQNQHLVPDNRFPIIARGFDSKTGEMQVQTAIQDTDTVNANVGKGANTVLNVSMLQDNISLLKELQYDASLQARYMAYNARVDFDKSRFSSSKEFSVSWFISCTRYYKAVELKNNPVLTADAAQLLTSNLPSFINQFGDEYISRQTIGNKAVVAYTYTTTDREERDAFSAKLNIAINAIKGGVTVNASFRDLLETSRQQSRLDIEAKIFGSNVLLGNILTTDLNEVSKKLKEIVDNLKVENAVVLEYNTSRYPELDNYNIAIDESISSEFMEQYLQVEGDIKIAKTVIDDTEDKNLKDNLQVARRFRIDYNRRLRRLAKDYFSKSDNPNEVAQAEKDLIDFIRMKLDPVPIPEPPTIHEIVFNNHEDILPNNFSIERTLTRLPRTQNIIVSVKGVAVLPATIAGFIGNTRIAYDVYVNGVKGCIFDKVNAAYHAVDCVLNFPRPANGNAVIKFGWVAGVSAGDGNPIRLQQGLRIKVD